MLQTLVPVTDPEQLFADEPDSWLDDVLREQRALASLASDAPAASATTTTTTTATARVPDPGSRDGFLDTIRAIATVRVVLWHTFATPLLSFFVASMPTMFFVAGSLLASSLDNRDAQRVIRDRARRLLQPFWLFGAFALTVMGISNVAVGARARLSPGSLIGWIAPIVDPGGSSWEGGWLSQPLWYLRAFLWLLVAAPLLRKGLRRFGNIVFVPPVLAVLGIDAILRSKVNVPGFSSWRWYVGDFALYSIFLLLGFQHRKGAFRSLTTAARTEWLAIFAVCAALWCTTQPLIGGVVNNSYPAHLLVGMAWLFAFLALEPVLRHGPSTPVFGVIIRWLTQRSMTVYLWHSTAIICALTLRDTVAPSAPTLLALPLIVVLVATLAALAGWMEDIAAKRPPRLWPTPIRALMPSIDAVRALIGRLPVEGRRGRSWATAGIGFALAMALVATMPSSADSNTEVTTKAASSSRRRPPAPSARPDAAVFDATSHDSNSTPAAPRIDPEPSRASTNNATATTDTAPAMSADVVASLQSTLDAWRSSQSIDGVTIAISLPNGKRWSAASGSMTADQEIEVTSVTKTFTSALILKLADEGKIDIDAPMPALTKVPGFPAGLTPRQLLNHSSGLGEYKESAEYRANPTMQVTPAEAVALASKQPLVSAPGTKSGYSSSGYLALGLLAEQVTGKTYKSLLESTFFDPLRLTATRLDEDPIEGWVGWSSGGIRSTMSDLTVWGEHLYRDSSVLSKKQTATMLDLNNPFAIGLGAWPVCPCSTDANGSKVYTAIGHHGGSGVLQYSPADGIVAAVFVTEPIFNGRITQQDLNDLLAKLRVIAA